MKSFPVITIFLIITTLFGSVLFGAGAQAQDAKLLAYWSFDDFGDDAKAVDEVNAIEAEIQGPSYEDDAARGSVMNIGAAGSLLVADGDFLNATAEDDQSTVTFWQRNDATGGDFSAYWMLSQNSNNGQRGNQAHVPWSNGQIYFDTAGCCDPTQRLNGTPAADIGDGGWHHFAFVKDGENKKVYVDGELELEADGADPLPDDFFEMRIGSDGAGNASLNGALDDFAIFASSLTADQVALLVAGATPLELVDDTDTDEDGMPDIYETKNGLDPVVNDAAGDLDGDGVLNFAEFTNRTNPQSDDTDGDGVKDGAETNTGVFVDAANTGSNPRSTDSDGDSLPDGVETGTGTFVSATNTGSDPNKVDTDGDTFEDGTELKVGTDPTNAESFPKSLWEVVTVEGLGAIDNFETADEWVADAELDRTQGAHLTLNFEGTGCVGTYPDPVPFDNMSEPGEDLNEFVVQGKAKIFISEGGIYTFGFGSDDGGYIDVGEQRVALFNANRGRGVTLGQITLIPGYYDVTALMWENGGGSCFDVFWAKGEFDAFDQGEFELLSPTSLTPVDSDNDGMDDNIENAVFGDLSKTGDGDEDNDTLTNAAEINKGTSPVSDDTDGDTLKDNVETGTGTWASAENTGTNPISTDSDQDGLGDKVETNTGTFVSADNTGTDPNKEDTDGDTFSDLREVNVGTDPTNAASFPKAPEGGLIAYWNFDDAADADVAFDTVGGISGAVTAEYTESGGGRTGSAGDYAMNFANGGNVEVLDVDFLDEIGAVDQFTISLWQKNEGTPNSSSFWIRADGFDRAAQAHIPWSDGVIYFDTAGGCCAADQRLNFTPSGQEGLEDFDFLDEQWHHYAFVKDTELKQVWIDGILAFELEGAAPMPLDSYTDLAIGSQADAAGPASAAIDDFAIYAVPLSQEQIIELAEGGTPGGGGSGVPFQILRVAHTPDKATITWNSRSGKSYSVVYSSDLVDFIEATDGVESAGDETSYEDDSITPDVKVRYYQVFEE